MTQPTPPAIQVGMTVKCPRIAGNMLGEVIQANNTTAFPGVTVHVVRFGTISGFLFDPPALMAIPVAEVFPAVCPTCLQAWPNPVQSQSAPGGG